MAYASIASIAPQFENFPNYWLKAYEQGTTTPKVMATDSTGATTVSKFEINTDGFIRTAGAALVIPFIDGAYDLWLFSTAALADANTTGGAIQLADNIAAVPSGGVITSKFTIQEDQSRGADFLEIRNTVDDIQIVSFADGTASGDAHVFKLPPDIRRDSHALLATAGTFGGENDIDFRTYLYSDYAIINASSAYQAETLSFLFDTKPSRNDGSKKDGTGGGGLSIADDEYAFDAAISIPSNRTDTPVTFPALPVQVNQYLTLEKRSTATRSFDFTPNTADLTVSESVSGNTILFADHERLVVAGQTLISTDKTGSLCEDSGNFKICRYVSSIGTSTVLSLVESGRKGCAEIFITFNTSGGDHSTVRKVVEFDGTTITDIVTPYDSTPAQITYTLVYATGVLELDMLYSGSLGASCRATIKAELMLGAV